MRHFPLGLAFLLAVAAANPSAQIPRVETVFLGTSEPGAETLAVAINSRGVVAGTIARSDDSSQAFTWTRSGGFRILLNHALAYDINDKGAVVGVQGCGEEEACELVGFVWTPSGGARYLGDMRPRAVNNRGVIVGECGDLLTWTACQWTNGVRRLLPAGFTPTDINERGAVSGYVRRDVTSRAAVWTGPTGLREIDSSQESRAFGINDGGFIVGDAVYPEGPLVRATVWTPSAARERRRRRSRWPSGSATVDGSSATTPTVVPGGPDSGSSAHA